MIKNLPPENIYELICSDFQDAWNSVAWNPSANGRGNFIFGLQASILLEFAARLCSSDASGKALKDISDTLFKIEPKYTTRLPGVCVDPYEFDLPYKNSKGDELLWAIFDLIRNGQAHQYQPIVVRLTDGVDFSISLTGAKLGRHLEFVRASPEQRRPEIHLAYRRQQDGLWLKVCPEILFLDIKDAIDRVGLLKRGLSFPNLGRPRGSTVKKKSKLPLPYYRFTSKDLQSCLDKAGHKKINSL